MKYLCQLLCFVSISVSATDIQSIRVQETRVVFEVAAQNPNPTHCVSLGNEARWAFELDSATGTLLYNTLVNAYATSLPVSVESGDDCTVLDGVERAQSIIVSQPSQQ